MSEPLEFDGDAMLGVRGPLQAYSERLSDVAGTLTDAVRRHDFGSGAEDELSRNAYEQTMSLLEVTGQIFSALGDAIGVQNGRLDAVRAIGEDTEQVTTAQAGSWNGSGSGYSR